jgi:hypothetical protein
MPFLGADRHPPESGQGLSFPSMGLQRSEARGERERVVVERALELRRRSTNSSSVRSSCIAGELPLPKEVIWDLKAPKYAVVDLLSTRTSGGSPSAVDRWDAAAEGPMVRRLSAGGDWIRTFSSARRWASVSASPTSSVYLGPWPRRRCRVTMICSQKIASS